MQNDFMNEPPRHQDSGLLLETLQKLDIKDQHLILQARSMGEATADRDNIAERLFRVERQNERLEKELSEARREVKRLVERNEIMSDELIASEREVRRLKQYEPKDKPEEGSDE